MRGKIGRNRTADSWRDSKKSKEARTHVHTSDEKLDRWGEGGGFIPDIFKVAVRGLGGLLLRGQVHLLREMPQAGAMEDPCRRRERQT